MSEATYYQRNKVVTLNRAKDYHENNKEVLREIARNKYNELSEEEKKELAFNNQHNNYYINKYYFQKD